MVFSIFYIAITALVGLHCASAKEYPTVTFPWGSYRATFYDEPGDFYTFTNVRFGKAPINELRFRKSVFPDPIPDPSRLQPAEGHSCYAAMPPDCPNLATFADDPVATNPSPFLLPGIPRRPVTKPSEDCLFADLYVPASALAGAEKLPIVVWIYGGGYVFGAKDDGFGDNMPFYNGTGLLRTAHAQNQSFIFITGNYRLGAFGWLAGPTMEQYGTPNAGLWDQRLLLDFAHQHSSVFGGDPNQIGVWGESAGAGSILHHLISTEPPVFSRTLMQSPAHLWQWDRSEQGHPARIFRNLTVHAGCPSSGAEAFDCLQKLNATTLQELNEALVNEEFTITGLLPFNPTVDGSLIKQLPTTAFQKGAIWKNVTSFIVSHVADESKSFVPCYVHDEPSFQRFLNAFLPGPIYALQRQAITDHYRDVKDPRVRTHDVIGDSSFLCNTRFVYDAYRASSDMFMMQYEFFSSLGAAVHTSDLMPTFYNTDIPEHDFHLFLNKTISPGASQLYASLVLARVKGLAEEYQPYLSSFAAKGVPEPDRKKGSPEWHVATPGEELKGVMQVAWGGWYSALRNNSVDTKNRKSTCEFWGTMAKSVENAVKKGGEGLEAEARRGFKVDL